MSIERVTQRRHPSSGPGSSPAWRRQLTDADEQPRLHRLQQAGDRLAEQVESYALPPWPWHRKLRSAVKEWQRVRVATPLD